MSEASSAQGGALKTHTEPVHCEGVALWLQRDPHPRRITAHYQDPLELIWLRCLSRLGWRLVRSPEVFASWDGERTLTLSTPEHMDPDDTLAQLIFHEVCHALVEGPKGWSKADWGLENIDARHLVHELACHRVQAGLAGRYGLRGLLAATTDWRPHYDALPLNPLAPCALAGELDAQAIELARGGLERAQGEPWRGALDEALSATQALQALSSLVALDLSQADEQAQSSHVPTEATTALPSLWLASLGEAPQE